MTDHQLLVVHEVGGIRYGDINLKMMLLTCLYGYETLVPGIKYPEST